MTFTERSKPTREALLAAARHSFAAVGYDRTTVRMVAADAGVDPSMVIRYFGSKTDLFAAAIDNADMQIDLRLLDLRAVKPSERGSILARHIIALWEDEPTGSKLAVLTMSATTNSVAAAAMQEAFDKQVLELVRALGPGRPDVEHRAGMLAAHVLGTGMCRYVLRLSPLADAPREEIVTSMAQVLQTILDG